jgi:hypothetical protein
MPARRLPLAIAYGSAVEATTDAATADPRTAGFTASFTVQHRETLVYSELHSSVQRPR